MPYTIAQISSIVRGKMLSAQNDVVITELALDSRKIAFPASSIFFALKGLRRDGHAFIREAYRKGVRNFVITDTADHDLPEANLIIVKNVLSALQTLTAYHRSRYNIPVIGITGSNGKTIVKEWLNQVLGSHFNIVRSPKSYNSQIGVPLSVWQLNESAELGIFEAGISQAEEMDKLQKIIQPTIGIFTNIGEAHSGGFLNKRQKILEKLRLFSSVDTLIYRKDYPELNEGIASLYTHLKQVREKPFNILSWSTVTEAELQIKAIEKTDSTTLLRGIYKGSHTEITIPFSDDASIENAIHCWCTMLHFGIAEDDIQQKMLRLHAVAMRLELKNGINNSSVINDSYSADLSSFRIALDFLSRQHQHPKRTVILTDFLETGQPEKQLYAEIAGLLAGHQVDRFIGIGHVMSSNSLIFQKTLSLPGKYTECRFFNSVDEFMHEFPRIHFGNETILIKGARVFALEQVNLKLEKQLHQTLLEIDLNALIHNLKAYQQLLQPSTRLMAMVKAFSYGSGSYEIASALQFNKVDYLAVAYADEGVELRRGGISLPIMVMNPDESAFDTLVSHDLEPEMYSPALLGAFNEFLKNEGLHQYPVHIELETGMNRLGFLPADLDYLIRILAEGNMKVQSVFSHLSGSETAELDEFTYTQAALFEQSSRAICEALSYTVTKHILNTSGIKRHPGLQYDMVRLGIGLYGVDSTESLDLKEVSTLRSAIAQIKDLKAGDAVSYGRSGLVTHDSRIATVRLGYADGYPRSLGNGRGSMLINGRLAPTIGNVCMDMTMIDITGLPGVREDDEVIVFGKGLPVAEVAKWAGTIPYEILTGVSQRVKRVYYQD